MKSTKIGNYKNEREFREILPSSVADHLTDLVFDVNFAVLFFRNQQEMTEAKENLIDFLKYQQQMDEIADQVQPGYLIECSKFTSHWEARPKRYIDNEELRFSLRSLEQYAPWVRHVYLVTNGQIPYWLNLDNPHLTVVTHEEIFESSLQTALPTFSSPSIETQISNIKGLSNNFIYFNDDFFLGKTVYLEDFMTHSSGWRFWLTYSLLNCATGCPHTWIKDGYCDSPCNNEACDFDGGDCESKTNETIHPMVIHPMEIQMAMERAYCSSGCSNAWIADGFCDSMCDVEACGFDGGDCGIERILAEKKQTNNRRFQFFNIESDDKTSHMDVPKSTNAVVGNVSKLTSNFGRFKNGRCESQLDTALRTSSFIASHSLFMLLTFKNSSQTNFTVNCKLELENNHEVNFDFTFYYNENGKKDPFLVYLSKNFLF